MMVNFLFFTNVVVDLMEKIIKGGLSDTQDYTVSDGQNKHYYRGRQ